MTVFSCVPSAPRAAAAALTVGAIVGLVGGLAVVAIGAAIAVCICKRKGLMCFQAPSAAPPAIIIVNPTAFK